MRNFIRLCIQHDPKQRPYAKELVKHPIFMDLANKPYYSTVSSKEMQSVGSTHSNLDKLSYNSSFESIHQSGLMSRASTPNLYSQVPREHLPLNQRNSTDEAALLGLTGGVNSQQGVSFGASSL